MIVRHAHRLYQFGAGDRRRPGAVDDHPDVRKLAPGQVTGVDQAGGGDDRGAVLVVVKDGDVYPFLHRRFDDDAVVLGDVFQVDDAEARFQKRHRVTHHLRFISVASTITTTNL